MRMEDHALVKYGMLTNINGKTYNQIIQRLLKQEVLVKHKIKKLSNFFKSTGFQKLII